MKGDASQFWAAVAEANSILRRLNHDESFVGFKSLFSRLLEELPGPLFKAHLLPATAAGQNDGTLIIGPGPDLESIVAALRALEVANHRELANGYSDAV
jgi:hypothetical protein